MSLPKAPSAPAAPGGPRPRGALRRLGEWCARRCVTVIVLWLAALVGLQFLQHAYGGEYSDDFALPGRMACWLAVCPALLASALRGRARAIIGAALGAMLLAERGRRRDGGTRVFPASSSVLAPVWILERGLCAWLAVSERVRFGGVRYRGAVIPTAAHSRRWLRRRLAAG